jgi:hypothetical protein
LWRHFEVVAAEGGISTGEVLEARRLRDLKRAELLALAVGDLGVRPW